MDPEPFLDALLTLPGLAVPAVSPDGRRAATPERPRAGVCRQPRLRAGRGDRADLCLSPRPGDRRAAAPRPPGEGRLLSSVPEPAGDPSPLRPARPGSERAAGVAGGHR